MLCSSNVELHTLLNQISVFVSPPVCGKVHHMVMVKECKVFMQVPSKEHGHLMLKSLNSPIALREEVLKREGTAGCVIRLHTILRLVYIKMKFCFLFFVFVFYLIFLI